MESKQQAVTVIQVFQTVKSTTNPDSLWLTKLPWGRVRGNQQGGYSLHMYDPSLLLQSLSLHTLAQLPVQPQTIQ